MKDAISSLYAHIILFFQQAVKWYNMGPAGRAISAIFKPYELGYKDTVEYIKICLETVNNIVDAAAGAEIRDINIIIQLQSQKVHEMQVQLKEMQMKIDGRINEVLQVVTILGHKTLTENVQLDVRDMKPRICDIQFSHIMDILTPKSSPEDLLRKS
ncbi:hypothetical protein W97_08193 [Coniosporium apollinis CBS 100218]|uniref:DUF7708 domain-containing protein n=1 Tax=Coniosporium apollinis (strain CBS 100218) TaxID=1168221 RepID=R7Z415_CONA1|nr:uncharacterized protein W97_08193 [Coniosporium apollinis CBS 100218]EON68935.1 hypothetical protein W97_08193 [Coniosporium apollinis CBS 100218]